MSDRDVSATATAAGQVEIEVVAWVTKFVGGDGSSRKLYYEPLRPEDTVRKVLRRLSGRFPELHKALWDAQTGDLAEHIEVLVNDAVLDLTHSLDSPLHNGDKLALIGQYLGG
jgi:molybdopterin converting factor small subunit